MKMKSGILRHLAEQNLLTIILTMMHDDEQYDVGHAVLESDGIPGSRMHTYGFVKENLFYNQ